VVIIVSILATLAVVGYRRLVLSSHTSEATEMVQSIRAAQEAFKAETGSYADISGTLSYPTGTTLSADAYPALTTPAKTPGSFKSAWGGSCGTNCAPSGSPDWPDLPVHVDQPLLYGYSTIAGYNTHNKSLPSIPGSGAPLGTITFGTPNVDWFIVTAVGDANGNKSFSMVVASSITNQVLVDNDGE